MGQGRIRSIKPEFFFDLELANLPMETRFAFVGLWCHADREGRLEDSPVRLKALIYPYDKRVDMDKILNQLSRKPFIHRYEANSKRYIQIIRWKEHQYVHATEKESIIPSSNGDVTVSQPLTNGEAPSYMEGKGMEGKGTDHNLPLKNLHGEFVLLTTKEYDMLCDSLGKKNTDSFIERVNDYIGAKGKKYNSHYHVIKSWWRKDHPETPSTGPAGREL